ncbi:hypothetical protein B0H10DRAFT_1948835 [Mycena sp. CBHHK59/15]|nr:hypothetical protein B0H10DRAFT_1948835 [Mycena sp. CBHHK59/15]
MAGKRLKSKMAFAVGALSQPLWRLRLANVHEQEWRSRYPRILGLFHMWTLEMDLGFGQRLGGEQARWWDGRDNLDSSTLLICALIPSIDPSATRKTLTLFARHGAWGRTTKNIAIARARTLVTPPAGTTRHLIGGMDVGITCGGVAECGASTAGSGSEF